MAHGHAGTGIDEDDTADIQAAAIARKNKIRFYFIIPLVALFMFLYGGAENISTTFSVHF